MEGHDAGYRVCGGKQRRQASAQQHAGQMNQGDEHGAWIVEVPTVGGGDAKAALVDEALGGIDDLPAVVVRWRLGAGKQRQEEKRAEDAEKEGSVRAGRWYRRGHDEEGTSRSPSGGTQHGIPMWVREPPPHGAAPRREARQCTAAR